MCLFIYLSPTAARNAYTVFLRGDFEVSRRAGATRFTDGSEGGVEFRSGGVWPQKKNT